ncbi:ArsR family transcriptional regulator [Algoriphagus sp. C2-6-M1]|uniref:ArsR family transcriptional regulator n=1 Tax=Algoriphagus persicinus TaxID=3108754 RepID=UPI002B39445F|nr:ArsR family transcriptional regulator [Algoriphagus sp. C2-6-M1]MEB2779582.1 ArsR family transcriptional regulator [Algoriphagus sp. C2-6-M1]
MRFGSRSLSTEKQLCPCDLSDILDMTTPAVSQHLRKLKDGRVEGKRVGQMNLEILALWGFFNFHRIFEILG